MKIIEPYSMIRLILLLLFLFAKAEASEIGFYPKNSYGVAVHLLPSKKNVVNFFDDFNIERFVSELDECGVGYLVVTLGQNSGAYLVENKRYLEITGYESSDIFPKVDFLKRLAKYLNDKSIKLIFYLPIRGPQNDTVALSKLSEGDERFSPSDLFLKKWASVIKEWSDDFGLLVSGWWFDGVYAKPRDGWAAVADAAKSGNANSIIAFNFGQGLSKAFIKLDNSQSYTAGEINNIDDVIDFPTIEKLDGMRLHVFTYLGNNWGGEGIRYSNQQLRDFYNRILNANGILTLDVNVNRYGAIYEPHRKAVCSILTRAN